MNFFFINNSKEEYERASIIFPKMNNGNIKNFLTHLSKSMEFLSDGLAGFKVDMFDIKHLKPLILRAAGEDFIDFYFYIYNLLNYDFNFISSENVIVQGKKRDFKLQVSDFNSYLSKVGSYFNQVYDYLEKE